MPLPRPRALLLLFASCCTLPGVSPATEADPILALAERHAREQIRALPGRVSIEMGRLDPRTRLPPCPAPQAYTPPGARPMGKTQVGVRCTAPRAWNVLIPVHVRVTGSYVSTGRALPAGHLIQAEDLISSEGELDSLPAGTVTDPAAVVGKTLRNALAAGQPLRSQQVQAPLVIRQGQTVRVISRGSGFAVSAEGRAVNDAAAGQLVRVRLSEKQVVSGTATADGSVELNF
ncbi:MAG: flagellar basal body P-ring formation protein FlgA [Azonexus sp.]|nr:flagellar basal body P-ring formation protein FlgA [Betaproteobacteria bacterium]MBK8918712.1 flagellar basal body P-ring formation protein FlgA [Betaproteobacteria bacterium]MBP6034645.1 flagellar basal body P-ring formation protein FlgA [Azonexus sp.]MBP6905185.1 flagellar basal body P-ring formation protein FlgA [Azonexus sp.]